MCGGGVSEELSRSSVTSAAQNCYPSLLCPASASLAVNVCIHASVCVNTWMHVSPASACKCDNYSSNENTQNRWPSKHNVAQRKHPIYYPGKQVRTLSSCSFLKSTRSFCVSSMLLGAYTHTHAHTHIVYARYAMSCVCMLCLVMCVCVFAGDQR